MSDELLYKYLHTPLSKEEARQIKQWIHAVSDAQLEKTLSELWINHTTEEARNAESYQTVTGKLQPLFSTSSRPKRDPVSRLLHWGRIAAIILLPLVMATGVYYMTKQYDRHIYAATRYHMQTGKGERATLLLPDGTKVSLNCESTFTYPASFGKTDRNVHLEGEAYFQVSPNEKLPFIVQAKQTYIKVVGTTFNIRAYPVDDWVETSLVEGKVAFYEISNPANRVALLPDQTARFNTTTRQFERNPIEQRLATAWKRGEIVFRYAAWPDIIEQISHYYGISIQQEGTQVPQEKFTGSFLQEDIDNVLRNLQIHYHFSYTKTGNHLKIKFE